MNTKHIIITLIVLTGTSCWGAARQEAPGRRGTVLPELPETLIAEIIEQMGPRSLAEMALTNPVHINEIKRTMDMEFRKLLAKHNQNLDEALLDAAKNNYPWAIAYLIQHGVNINVVNKHGWTALMLAAEYGHKTIVTQLIATNADVNTPDKASWTALMLAALKGREDMVTRLIAAGADINARNQLGSTALKMAAEMGHETIVAQLKAAEKSHRLLVQHNGDAQRALFDAVINNYPWAINYLRYHGANVNMADENGQTALIIAAQNGYEAVTAQLLSAGADIDAKDLSGATALAWAVRNGHEAIVTQLIAAGADVNVRNIDGETALWGAVANGHEDVAKLLVGSGADFSNFPNDLIRRLEDWIGG